MNTPDLVNGVFEAVGGLAVLRDCRALYCDKMLAGVRWSSRAFFFSWGVWNLYFYPALDQWASFAGGLVIAAGNLVWLVLAAHYLRNPRGHA